ncbi:MAG: ArsR family transcriptional regulator [Gallionellaceae bacterium]
MPVNQILEYLKKHGESMDSDIATAINLPMTKTRTLLAELIAKTDVIACETIKFEKGKKIEGLSCRVSGFTPKAKPGAKSKVQLKLS